MLCHSILKMCFPDVGKAEDPFNSLSKNALTKEALLSDALPSFNAILPNNCISYKVHDYFIKTESLIFVEGTLSQVNIHGKFYVEPLFCTAGTFYLPFENSHDVEKGKLPFREISNETMRKALDADKEEIHDFRWKHLGIHQLVSFVSFPKETSSTPLIQPFTYEL